MINVYCDESCHLENDGNKIMVIGAIYCPSHKTKEINEQIKEIKSHNLIPSQRELKWTKVSESGKHVYLDLVNYFFDNPDLHFRGLVVTIKDKINHKLFHQTHDDWYYKIYYNMLISIFYPTEQYQVYIDIKDSNSKTKVAKLHKILCSKLHDFPQNIIQKIQIIRSHEVEMMQITDLLIGALSYNARNLNQVTAKNEIINTIKTRSHYSLDKSTLLRETKFNILLMNLQE